MEIFQTLKISSFSWLKFVITENLKRLSINRTVEIWSILNLQHSKFEAFKFRKFKILPSTGFEKSKKNVITNFKCQFGISNFFYFKQIIKIKKLSNQKALKYTFPILTFFKFDCFQSFHFF